MDSSRLTRLVPTLLFLLLLVVTGCIRIETSEPTSAPPATETPTAGSSAPETSTPAPAASPTTSTNRPSGKPESLWVSSIPQGAKVYVRGRLFPSYPGIDLPEWPPDDPCSDHYFAGMAPVELDLVPGSYEVCVAIETSDTKALDRPGDLEWDEAYAGAEGTDRAGVVVDRKRIYRITAQMGGWLAGEQYLLIALFQKADEPYSTLLSWLPDEALFDVTEDAVLKALTERGVAPQDIPTITGILRNGGKVALKGQLAFIQAGPNGRLFIVEATDLPTPPTPSE